jgi:hypothetical protein
MKAVKIILAIVVVALIGIFVTKWLIHIAPADDPDIPKNLYTNRIESEIDSLKKIPENKFCNDYYLKVQASIAEYYKSGSLGLTSYKDGSIWKEKKDDNLNNQWNEILCKNLYSAYAPKFIKQAMYVFKRSEWKDNDLEFIRSEVKNLKSSAYLGSTGVVTSLDEINTILAKYDEVNNFIKSCNGYTYSNYDLHSTFPDVSDKIQRSRAYITNNLDNSFVNNCTRLKEELQTIPYVLFEKHLNYLIKKIHANGAKYTDSEFDKQREYDSAIYTPLRNQVDALNNDVYGVGDNIFSNGYNSVYKLLSDYNHDAFNHYKK